MAPITSVLAVEVTMDSNDSDADDDMRWLAPIAFPRTNRQQPPEMLPVAPPGINRQEITSRNDSDSDDDLRWLAPIAFPRTNRQQPAEMLPVAPPGRQETSETPSGNGSDSNDDVRWLGPDADEPPNNDGSSGDSSDDSSDAAYSTSDEVDQTLCVNDVIEFYHPTGIAGDPRMLRRCFITEVHPESETPIHVQCGFLPIRLESRFPVKKIENGVVACFRPIHRYILENGVMSRYTANEEIVSEMTAARAEIDEAANAFWRRVISD